MYDDFDLKILSILQEPLELEPQPFERLAQKLGIPAEKVLEIIKGYIDSGVIRRFAGIVKHDRAGYHFNAMVALEVDSDLLDKSGGILSGLSFITHCYSRTAYPDWPYNLYAMMHARDKIEFEERLGEIKNKIQYNSMAVLESKREFKKTHFQITFL